MPETNPEYTTLRVKAFAEAIALENKTHMTLKRTTVDILTMGMALLVDIAEADPSIENAVNFKMEACDIVDYWTKRI